MENGVCWGECTKQTLLKVFKVLFEKGMNGCDYDGGRQNINNDIDKMNEKRLHLQEQKGPWQGEPNKQ